VGCPPPEGVDVAVDVAYPLGALNALGIAVVIVGLVAMWLQRPGPRSIAVRLREEPER
jgi:hypothetical protein